MLIKDALNYFSYGYLFKESAYTSGESLIKELSQYSECESLIEEAKNVIQKLGLSALEVRFEPTKCGFNAEQDSNVIRINPDLSANFQRFLCIFELNNLIQHKEHCEAWESAIEGVYEDAEEYARTVELIEYRGLIRTNVVSQAVNKQKSRFFRAYIENPNQHMNEEFDYYYSSYLPDYHKEYYRRIWRKLYNIENPPPRMFNNSLEIALSVSIIALACLKYRSQLQEGDPAPYII